MKFLVGGIIVIIALAWLGFLGFKESKAYYVTVEEFNSMKPSLDGETFKLAGDVIEGSIDRTKPQMEFVIGSGKATIKVRYTGTAVIPDTFKGGSKALVEGTVGPDGIFEAHRLEAKCASKYEAEYEKRSAS